uniref:Tyrosine specific protein phosphatases domain-containing protein n=1 Tax=Oryza meridionalis TaxID=40149 RepID=A0A0E0CAL8_9ORYZ
MGWGISRLIGLKAAVFLSVAYFFHRLDMTLLSFPLIYASVIALLVSIASHPSIDLPLLLGKGSNGSFPVWSWIMFSPFLLFIHLFVLLRRFVKNEPLYTEIADGVYVGGWPSSVERLPPGEPAVIDCTCELPRSSTISENSYLCVATWDTRAPQPSQIESAVRWALRKRSQNKAVYVHCAYGHGRSVCVMCALLVALGLAEDWKAAEQIIREKRPSISMNSLHRKSLEEWAKHLLTPSKRSGESDRRGIVGSLFLKKRGLC